MQQKLTISVIIPAQNEQDSIVELIKHIKNTSRTNAVKEIIVAVNGTDLTAARSRKAGAIVVEVGSSRAIALNGGQAVASGDILYFLHADSLTPIGWDTLIINSYTAGYHAGCFCLQFDSDHPLLRFSASLSKYNWKRIRFGDQSLYVGRDIFIKAGKYDEAMKILEDREIINRIIKISKFTVLQDDIITSDRKYQIYGYWRLQSIFLAVNVLYFFHYPHMKIFRLYRKLLEV